MLQVSSSAIDVAIFIIESLRPAVLNAARLVTPEVFGWRGHPSLALHYRLIEFVDSPMYAIESRNLKAQFCCLSIGLMILNR